MIFAGIGHTLKRRIASSLGPLVRIASKRLRSTSASGHRVEGRFGIPADSIVRMIDVLHHNRQRRRVQAQNAEAGNR